MTQFLRAPGQVFAPMLIGLCVLLAGCQPKIGDKCENAGDCSATGDRLCDITEPGGYCTVFNCEPGTCPEEAKCILFAADPSTVAGCDAPYGNSPYQRSFCLKTCSAGSDCRSGYDCVDMRAVDNPWGAVVIDGGSGKVCAVAYSAAPPPEDRSGEVCTGAGGQFEMPPETTTPAAGGVGGAAGGAGGAGNPGVSGGGAGGV